LSYTVIVHPVPEAVASLISDFCGCATLTLDGTASTPGMLYSWSSSAGSVIANSSFQNTTAFSCFSDVFTLVVIDSSFGCSDTATAIANHVPMPSATATVTPDLFCDGDTITVNLNGNGSDTTSGTTYHWYSNNPSSTIVDTTAISTIATVSSPTVFYFTVTDSLGCDSTITDTVNFYPLPVFAAFNPFICTSDAVRQSTLTISGTGLGSTFVWDSIPSCVTPSTATTSSQTFDFSTCGAGVYHFYVTVTDGVTGCVKQVHDSVTVITGVTLTVSTDTTICEGGIVTLTGSGANSYTWMPGGATTPTIVLAGLTASGSPYQFIVSGVVGVCSDMDTVMVYVNPTPQILSVNGPLTVCEGDSNIAYSVNPSGGNYIWTIADGIILSGANSDTVNVQWDSSGTGTLTVVDTNAFGCRSATYILTVTVNPLPVTSVITGPDSVCEFSTTSYFVNANSGSTYNWAVTGGAIVGSSTTNIISVTWGAAGAGIIQVNETNAAGCSSVSTSLNVTINPLPLPLTIDGNISVCENDTMNLYSVASTGGIYNWTVTGGTITSGQTTDSIYVNWGSAGQGVITYTETNIFGCTSIPGTLNVTINPFPVATAAPDSANICQGVALQIFGTTNVGNTVWYSSGTGTFSNDTLTSPVYSPGVNDTGYTSLTMIATSACGTDTASVVVYIAPVPQVNITATQSTICFGDSTTLTATGGGNYLWSTADTTVSIIVHPTSTTNYFVTVNNIYNCPAGVPNGGADQTLCAGDSANLIATLQNAGGLQWTSSGTGTFSPNTISLNSYYIPSAADTVAGVVTLVAAATGSCLNLTDTVVIFITHAPTVYAGSDTTISGDAGSGITIPSSATATNVGALHWTTSGTGTFSPSDSVINATYIPSADDFTNGPVTITLTNTNACGTVSRSFIIDFTAFIIPNVFTPYPSSPGYNDFFEIKNLPRNSKIKIWDRWGLLVFVSDDYRNDWDAALLKAEDFYYILTTERKEYHGWIKVIR
jgi:gliding motility-associated-like protein